jgi:putative membrane protein
MRPLPLGAGLLVLALAWLGLGLGPPAFTVHMSAHVAVVAIAAPLLALGIGGSALDPSARLPLLASPLFASALEFVVVWGWHSPLLHEAAREQPAVLVAEQASFLIVGLLVWLSAFGGVGEQRTLAGGIFALFVTSMHMTLLGALLALAPRPLFDHHGHGAVGLGLDVLQDQQAGGAIMLTVGGASYLLGGLVLMARLLRAPAAAGEGGRR